MVDCWLQSFASLPLQLLIGDLLGVALLLYVLHIVEIVINNAAGKLLAIDFNLLNVSRRAFKQLSADLYKLVRKFSFVKRLLQKEQVKIEKSFDEVSLLLLFWLMTAYLSSLYRN